MKQGKGSYALVFHTAKSTVIDAGGLGALQLLPGYYVYCGSAFGPGGVQSRTAHHCAISQRPHWHIDYLRPQLELHEIWYTLDPKPREHQWTAELVQLRGASFPFRGFGSSDCSCQSHLVRLGHKPSFKHFRRRLRKLDSKHASFYCERV